MLKMVEKLNARTVNSELTEIEKDDDGLQIDPGVELNDGSNELLDAAAKEAVVLCEIQHVLCIHYSWQ